MKPRYLFLLIVFCLMLYGADDLYIGGLELNSGTMAYEISTDTTLVTNADTTLVSEKAIKTYVDNSSTTQLTVIGETGEITVTTANDTAHVELPDDVIIGDSLAVVGNQTVGGTLDVTGAITASNLSGTNTGDEDLTGYVPYINATTTVNLNTQDIEQNDDTYHYFGTDNNMRQYFDGTQGHIEPAYVVTNPDTLQILFSNPDSIFTADGDIKDWSGNGYDAELDSSYCISYNGTDNRIDLGYNWLNDMIGGKGYCKIETYIKFDIQSNDTFVFTGNSYNPNDGTWTVQLWARARADSTLRFTVRSLYDETNRNLDTTSKIVDNTWYKVEYVADLTNNDMYIYVDDVAWASNTSVGFDQNTFYSSALPPTVSDGIGQDARLTNPYPKYDIAYLKFYDINGIVAEFPFSGYGNDKVYDVAGKDKFSVSGTAGTLWGEKQNEYHYNIEYGFTDSTNIYIPYALDGTVLASGGTNHPAGLWHNNCETQICFNPLDIGAITTATGFTSTDFFTYAEIVDFMGTGTGDFTVTEMSGTKYDMTTFARSVSEPDAGYLAVGKEHDPDAQLSNKSRGITNTTKNLELLNNSGDSLLIVYDGGLVTTLNDLTVGDDLAVMDDASIGGNVSILGGIDVTGSIAGATLNTGQGANELYAMNQDVETTDDVTFNSVTTNAIIRPYVAKTANYTLTATDYQVECTANTFTISLPTAVGITGTEYSIKNTGTGIITVDADGTETIDGELTQTLWQWDNLVIVSNGTNWIIK